MKTLFDQAEFIELSINNLVRNIIIGGTLAILILLLFLRDVRSTLVIGTAIPISLIATFTLVYFRGMTLNMMTLGGLALGAGMMVDNSIIVLENIFRHRQEGEGLIRAAIEGSSEMANAILASTLTTIAVFLPIVFVEGLASQLFTPMAFTITFALAASLLVALTLVPMMSSKVLTVMPGKIIIRKAAPGWKGCFTSLRHGLMLWMQNTGTCSVGNKPQENCCGNYSGHSRVESGIGSFCRRGVYS